MGNDHEDGCIPVSWMKQTIHASIDGIIIHVMEARKEGRKEGGVGDIEMGNGMCGYLYYTQWYSDVDMPTSIYNDIEKI
jgi:hypothetical protein